MFVCSMSHVVHIYFLLYFYILTFIHSLTQFYTLSRGNGTKTVQTGPQAAAGASRTDGDK